MKSVTILAVLILCVSQASATHGTRMVGFNALAVGRGGTNLAIFDNSALMMTNPGGLSFMGSRSLDGDFSLMVPGLHFTNTLNDADGKTNYFPIMSLGYIDPQPDQSWAWGFGVFTQGGMGADFTLNHDLFRDQNGALVPQTYHSKLAVMEGGPSAAYRISPELSVGASLHLAYGMMEFSMPYSLSPSMMRGVANPGNGMTFGDMFSAPPAQGGFGYSEVTAAAAMNSLKGFGVNGKIGFAWKATPDLTFGLSYSSPMTISLRNGTAVMDMTAQMNNAFGKAMQGYMAQNPGATQADAQAAVMQQFTQMGIDLSKGVIANYNLEAKLKFPQSIGLGTAYSASKDLRLALDLEWINWKNAFDNMALTFSGGDNSNINRMLGNQGAFSLDFPMQWKDQFAVRAGLEYNLQPDITLRGGYAYGNSPVPDNTVFPVFPAVVEHHLTLGGSYHLSPAVTIHAAYEFALAKSETASSSSVLAREYDNSTSRLGESIGHLSLSWQP